MKIAKAAKIAKNDNSLPLSYPSIIPINLSIPHENAQASMIFIAQRHSYIVVLNGTSAGARCLDTANHPAVIPTAPNIQTHATITWRLSSVILLFRFQLTTEYTPNAASSMTKKLDVSMISAVIVLFA